MTNLEYHIIRYSRAHNPFPHFAKTVKVFLNLLWFLSASSILEKLTDLSAPYFNSTPSLIIQRWKSCHLYKQKSNKHKEIKEMFTSRSAKTCTVTWSTHKDNSTWIDHLQDLILPSFHFITIFEVFLPITVILILH